MFLNVLRLFLPLAALWLSACATLPKPEASQTYTGRFALKAQGPTAHGNTLRENLSGRFTLALSTDTTTLDLASPLGNTLARLQSGPQGAQLQVPEDGGLRTLHHREAEVLAEEVLGFPLPLNGLRWWIRGEAIPERPAQVQQENGVSKQIEQDGWRIQIEERFEGHSGVNADPRRLSVQRAAGTHSPAINLRVVLDAASTREAADSP